MKYKTLIVDDELEAQKRLVLYLERFDELELLPTAKHGKEALEVIGSASPNIVFLDVEMPEMNGIEVLGHCEPPLPYIIFFTAYNQYAVEAFDQNAVDYILKPYTFERLEKAVKRALVAIQKDRLALMHENIQDVFFELSKGVSGKPSSEYISRIAVKSIGRTVFIPVDDIIQIEAADQYVEVYTEKKMYTVRESMDKLERTLDPQHFFRTHRSSIVSLHQVVAFENVDKHLSHVILNNGKKVKISNSRKAEFKARMKF